MQQNGTREKMLEWEKVLESYHTTMLNGIWPLSFIMNIPLWPKIVVNAVPVITAHYMHVRYYSLARVDINRQIDVQALCDPKTLLGTSLSSDYVKCFYLLLVYWFKRQRDRTLESTESPYCNMFLRSGYTCSLWYRTILKWASKVNPGLLRFCLRGSVIGPVYPQYTRAVYPRHLLVFNWALW